MAAVISSPTESKVAVSATKLLINGEWTNSESGKTFATINPATGKEICQVAEADSADVNKAVKAARAAFDKGAWRKMSGSERGRLLNKLADLIEKNADELAKLESLDNGKPYAVAKAADLSIDGRLLPLLCGLGRQVTRQNCAGERRLLLLHPA